MGADVGSSTAEREMVVSRLIDAPRALVFEAWSDVQHLAKWWGPDGFTTTTTEMEFRPGGRWVYVMHGPDGKDYPNWIEYRKIVKNERLEYAHGGEDENGPDAKPMVAFESTVTFDDEGGKTRITLRALFPTKEALDHVVKEYGAIEGGKQTIARLAEHVAALEVERGEFTITRIFAAPRALVFAAWTQPEHLAHWWGNHGTVLTSCEVDARNGGVFKYCMRTSDGTDYWVAGEYHEVSAPEKLVFTCGLTSVTPSHDALWTVEFADEGNSTRMTLHQKLFDLSHARAGAKPGLLECLERLEARLAVVAKK